MMTPQRQLHKKQKALDYFTREILSSKVGNDIDEMILFGSLAQGEPDYYSDIDLVVFTNDPGVTKREANRISYDTLMKFDELIDSQIFSVDQYRSPQTYFVYQAITKGKRLLPRSA